MDFRSVRKQSYDKPATFSLSCLISMLGLGAFPANAQSSVQLVHDIVTGPGSGNPSLGTVYNGALYFTANDGAHGQELWKYTGSAVPTMVYDISPGAADGATYGSTMAVFHNKLYFSGKDSSRGPPGIWKAPAEVRTRRGENRYKYLYACIYE